ncbi:TonB-dependent receptor domain-containing protein [Sphingomonas koreensis]
MIRNPNLESTSPINVVSEKEIELQQANVAEELVRELPGAVPSIGSAVNNGNNGASFVDLRGLGTNRNLVLVDGSRLVPATLGGVFDLNNIPLALVRRVDILTGGASTAYGADAVTGVVNFITRKDFAGLDLSLSEQITQKGDGNVFRGDLTMGANFADDRGNAVLSVGYQKAKPVYQGDRDYSRFSIASDDGTGGGSGTSVPSRFSLPGLGTRQVDAAGTAFNPTAAYTPFNFNPYNLYQTPFERYNIYAAARYEVSDAVEVYSRGIFSKNKVSTIIAPSGAFNIEINLPLNNPYLTTALRDTFCAANGIGSASCTAAGAPGLRPGDAAYREVVTVLARRAVENGPRISEYTTTFFDYRAGLRGALTPSIHWDVFGAYGESENTQIIKGYTLNSRFRQAVRAGNATTCFDSSNNCVPVNVFGPVGSITPAQAGFLTANSSSFVKVSLAQAGGIVSGDVGFASPMANDLLAFAVGAEYRKYKATQGSDLLAQQGDLGGAGAATPAIAGGFEVKEAFGELIVPIIQDRPFFHELSVEGGIRYSAYKINAPGQPKFNTTTWKVGGSWEPVEQIKLRANYSRAVRAPNIEELFSPRNTSLVNLSNDPCATINDRGVRIAPAPTGELRSICLAQGATAANVNNIQVPTAGQANATGGGNLALEPEKSNSYSFGAVIKPVRGLSLSVDYFNIDIKGAITTPTPGDAIAACFGSGAMPPAGASATTACTQIRRSSLTGGLDGDPASVPGLFLPRSNLGRLKTSGIDFMVNYTTDLGFGALALNGVLTYTDKSIFQATPTSFARDCLGYYSGNCNPQSTYQANARATLTIDAFDVSLAWRYFSAIRYEGQAGDFAARGFTAANRTLFRGTLPTSAGPLADKQVDFNRIKAHHYFDLTTRAAVNEHFSLTLVVQNLLNQKPPIVGSEAGTTEFNSGNTFPSTYDALGRRYVATARLRF